jgi:hypothetical protein
VDQIEKKNQMLRGEIGKQNQLQKTLKTKQIAIKRIRTKINSNTN